jgi:lipoprotein-releasing system permease protein
MAPKMVYKTAHKADNVIMAFFKSDRSQFFIAFRYIFGKSNKGERYLLAAAAGIALSLIPIMVTLTVTDGMIQGITERFLELGTGHIQVRYDPTAKNDELPDELKMSIDDAAVLAEEKDGVNGIWREIDGIGIVLGQGGKTGATIRATEPSFWEDAGSKKYLTVLEGEGGLLNDTDVLLGSALASSTGASVGKRLRIMTLHNNKDGRAIPKTEIFTVRGIVSSGYHEIDSMWCIISYNAGLKLLDTKYAPPYLVIKVNNPFRMADNTAREINSIYMDGFNSMFHAYTWKQLQPAQYSSYESTRQLLLFIMALIVLIAAINVSAATSMLVVERERDIAVLKTYGASPSYIKNIFVKSSFLTGLVGAVAGIVLGLLVGVNINHIIRGIEGLINIFTSIFNAESVKLLDPDYYLQSIPIIINWGTVTLIGWFTIFCSLFASYIPASYAARTKPMELLRKF